MKWILIAFVVGVTEIASIAKLHSILGLTNLVIIYVATTFIGLVILFLKHGKFSEDFKATKSLSKKFRKRARKNLQSLESEDFEKLEPMMGVTIYIGAAILILIPGLVTDIAGILLLIPNVSSWLIAYQIKKAHEIVRPAP